MELGTWKEEWTVNMSENKMYHNVQEQSVQVIISKDILTLLKSPNTENRWWSFAHDRESRHTNHVLSKRYKSPDNVRQLFSCNVRDILIPCSSYMKSGVFLLKKVFDFTIKILFCSHSEILNLISHYSLISLCMPLYER